MRKFFWQRWALMFLLMSRLVIGELGHAMPVAHADDMGAAQYHQIRSTTTDSAADCPEHDGSNRQMPTLDHVGEVTDSSGEHDCCQSGECECPCLHVPCAALDAFVLNSIATASPRTPQGAEGLVSQRPSGLFRPPARFS